MKKFFLSAAVVAACLFGTVSCDKHGGELAPAIPQAILDAFENDYASAVNVSWKQKSGHAVADFTLPEADGTNTRNSAWYSLLDYTRDMNEKELPYEAVSEAVRLAFEATDYAREPWQRDREVDCLLRDGYESIYVIGVEKKETGVETEVDLYYTAAGELVRELVDADPDEDYEEYLPQTPDGSVEDWLAQRFPNARIIDVDREHDMTEVEFVADGLVHEVIFRAGAFALLKTEYEGRSLEWVDAAVLAAVQTLYPDGIVEEVTRYETADRVYYSVEVRNGRHEEECYLDENGQQIERPAGDAEGGVSVGEVYEQFVAGRYPGAVIAGRDDDDGYVVIEIRHEGVEKDVRFNGRGEWVDTTWDIASAALPQAILDALATDYAGYRVDREAEVVETSAGMAYAVELEGRNELLVLFDATGKVIKEYTDD